MIIGKVTTIILMLLTITQPLIAQEIKYSEDFNDCMDSSDGITVNMLECFSEEYKRQDERLNKVYKELMSQLSSERKEYLREAQKLWIKYRDANCEFYFDPDGGSSSTVNGNECFLRETVRRADELEKFKE